MLGFSNTRGDFHMQKTVTLCLVDKLKIFVSKKYVCVNIVYTAFLFTTLCTYVAHSSVNKCIQLTLYNLKVTILND